MIPGACAEGRHLILRTPSNWDVLRVFNARQ